MLENSTTSMMNLIFIRSPKIYARNPVPGSSGHLSNKRGKYGEHVGRHRQVHQHRRRQRGGIPDGARKARINMTTLALRCSRKSSTFYEENCAPDWPRRNRKIRFVLEARLARY